MWLNHQGHGVMGGGGHTELAQAISSWSADALLHAFEPEAIMLRHVG